MLIFLVNVNSNGGKTKDLLVQIRDRMEREVERYKIIETHSIEEAQEAIRIERDKGHKYFIAVGGDGTLKSVAEAIVNHGGILGIIPSGTGNDFMKSLNISKNLSDNIDRILMKKIKPIDYGLANDRFFINVASIGFDADVAVRTEPIKKTVKSNLAYVLGLIKSFFLYKNIEVENISENTEDRSFLFAIANGKYYGGGFQIAPDADLDDGYLDVVFANNINKFQVLTLIPSILKANHIRRKPVETRKIKNYSLRPKKGCMLSLDGELRAIKADTRIDFSIVEKGLNIICWGGYDGCFWRC